MTTFGGEGEHEALQLWLRHQTSVGPLEIIGPPRRNLGNREAVVRAWRSEHPSDLHLVVVYAGARVLHLTAACPLFLETAYCPIELHANVRVVGPRVQLCFKDGIDGAQEKTGWRRAVARLTEGTPRSRRQGPDMKRITTC